MTLSDLDMAPIREHAALLIDAYVPSDTGDARFDHIAKDYGGLGTTCGYLCHWLMWRLGSDSTDIINRGEPGFTYVPGANISRIWNLGQPPFISVFGTDLLQQGLQPQYGDIVFIKQGLDGPQVTEHVFVFLDLVETFDGTLMWRTAEAGQPNEYNQECARIKWRELRLGAEVGAQLGGGNPARDIIGWISLAELSYNFMPPFPPMTPPPFDPILMGLGVAPGDIS
jgi:hypothetical protein